MAGIHEGKTALQGQSLLYSSKIQGEGLEGHTGWPRREGLTHDTGDRVK